MTYHFNSWHHGLSNLWLQAIVVVLHALLYAPTVAQDTITCANDNYVNCRAQRGGARLGDHDVAPVARCSLAPENVKCMSAFGPQGPPCNFGTRDLHLLLGVSKYVRVSILSCRFMPPHVMCVGGTACRWRFKW